MVSGIKDRLGENLAIGDLCVCYNSMRTGSSTTRLVQYEGEIIKFTNKFIKVKCVFIVDTLERNSIVVKIIFSKLNNSSSTQN